MDLLQSVGDAVTSRVTRSPRLALGVCVLLIAYLASSETQRQAMLERFLLGRPQYVNVEAERAPLPSSKPISPCRSEYATTFPPPQRHLLETPDVDLDEADFKDKLVGFEEDYLACSSNKFLPSGLRIHEVQALGDFPDFSRLTGVPHPQPYNGFGIDRALPRPYRPNRWPYHQTMSLSKLEPDWWIELESTYRTRIAQRQALFEKDGEAVLAYLPGSELACKELMEMVLQYVVHRYPHYFSLAQQTQNGESTTLFHNRILNVTTDVYADHPLHVLLEHIPEDFVLMLRHPDTGQYVFRAGVICSSLGWNLGSKFNLPLASIHDPVPLYRERMEFSMDRFFSKMACNKPIQRGSWGFEVDQPLYMAPGDPAENLYKTQQHPGLTPERIHLRVDWQTLRRLPLSGGIVFNFKALFTPLTQLRQEPYVPSLCLKVLREGNEAILKYKNTWHTEHVVIPALEAYEKEQIRKGVIEKGWEPKTLDEAPFFPGWEAKWRARQGF